MSGALGGTIVGSSAISSLGGSLGSSIFGISSFGISTISNLGSGVDGDIAAGGSEGILYIVGVRKLWGAMPEPLSDSPRQALMTATARMIAAYWKNRSIIEMF